MLDGVSYLTSENLFHSELNMDNVVINSDGVVKISKRGTNTGSWVLC